MCYVYGNLCLSWQPLGTSCSCDLLVGSCDPNCCCDKECEEQIIRAFTDCVNHQNRLHHSDCYVSRNTILVVKTTDHAYHQMP